MRWFSQEKRGRKQEPPAKGMAVDFGCVRRVGVLHGGPVLFEMLFAAFQTGCAP